MRDATTEREITAAFPYPHGADRAVHALVEAGVPRSSIEITEREPETGPGHEAPYLWRLVVIIVLWSILGGVWGALIGLVLAVTVGPLGTSGLILQVVAWMIMGHLVVGMVAGYVVLADRASPEMPPDRPVTVLTLRVSAPEAEMAERVLREHDAAMIWKH